MNLGVYLKLLHILTAIWFICGLVGRGVTLRMAAAAPDVPVVDALLGLGDIFEKRMVIPGSMAVFAAGLLTAWVQGWPILGFIQGGASNWVLVSILLYLSMFPLIRLVFLPRGRVFAAALQDARGRGSVTQELRNAFADRVVAAAHVYELAVVALIVVLMVIKPF